MTVQPATMVSTAVADAQSPMGSSLTDHNMPETAVTADQESVRARNRYQNSIRIEQLLLVVATGAGLAMAVFGTSTLLQASVVGALLLAFAVRGWRNLFKPDSQWYSLRSVAEGIKSQTWRYVMGANPYQAPESHTNVQADPLKSPETQFVETCQELWTSIDLPDPQSGRPQVQITEAMKRVRDASLPERVRLYVRDRIENQRDWYRKKANSYRRASFWLNALILFLEGAAGLTMAARFFGVQTLDFYGIATTAVAGIAVWMHMKEYATLKQRYMSMARTLQSYVDLLNRVTTPEQISAEGWSQFVTRVEGLMEQEHESWLRLYKAQEDPQTAPLSWQQFEAQLTQSGIRLKR